MQTGNKKHTNATQQEQTTQIHLKSPLVVPHKKLYDDPICKDPDKTWKWNHFGF